MNEMMVYLWLKLDTFSVFLIATGVLGIVGALCIPMFMATNCYDYTLRKIDPKIPWKKVIGLILIFSFFLTLGVLCPNSRQFAVIKILPPIVNSEIAQELPQDAKEMYSMAKDYFKEMLKSGDEKAS